MLDRAPLLRGCLKRANAALPRGGGALGNATGEGLPFRRASINTAHGLARLPRTLLRRHRLEECKHGTAQLRREQNDAARLEARA